MLVESTIRGRGLVVGIVIKGRWWRARLGRRLVARVVIGRWCLDDSGGGLE